MAGEDPQHFAQYLVQAIARGANPSTYIMGTPATTPYGCLEVAGQLTRFHRDQVDVYRDLVPAAKTLLVRPDLSSPARSGVRRSLPLAPAAPCAVRRAAGRAARRGRPEPLSNVSCCRTSDQCPNLAAIDSYAGRAVVATGTTAVRRGSAGQTAAGCPVRDRGSYPLLASEGGVPVFGAFDVVEAPSDAEVGLRAMSRAPYGPPEKCHGHELLDHPGLVQAGRRGAVPVDDRAGLPGGGAERSSRSVRGPGGRSDGDGPAGAGRDRGGALGGGVRSYTCSTDRGTPTSDSLDRADRRSGRPGVRRWGAGRGARGAVASWCDDHPLSVCRLSDRVRMQIPEIRVVRHDDSSVGVTGETKI